MIGRIHDTSNYVLSTSNILVKLITDFGTNYWTPSGTNDIYLNQLGSVGIGTNTPQNKLHIYNTTSSTLRLETNTTGTASVIFQRGATNDIRTDYRIINDADILKFQYQDNLINFGATGSDIMWVYDKRTEFIKDGYFKGSMGIGMLPNVNALSITGDTYMDGSLGINTSAGSYPLDVYGDVNIDGDVGIGANPSAGVKLYVSGTTRLGGSVGIGVAPTTYALDIIGSARVDGYVGIGTIPSSSTYRLDILGNFRTQGGIVSTGIIQAGNGLTASSGLITASAGISSTTLTASGLITANGGITIPAGQTLTIGGTLSLSTLTASGLITANGGITIPAGQTLTSSGTLTANVINTSGLITANGGLTISSPIQLLPTPITLTLPSDLVSSPAYTTYALPAVSNTIYKCAIFKSTQATSTPYSITIPAGGLLCDVLMVGGGGAGGKDIGAGGGGGAVLYGQNIFIPAGVYSISVGGRSGFSGETRGYSTTGFGATILGGGCGGNATWANNVYANSGGSGSGGKSISSDLMSQQGGEVGVSTKGALLNDATLYNGNKGGLGGSQNNQVASAGGGGANAVGGNGSGGTAGSVNVGGAGIGISILDTLFYWGGGGGGGNYISTPSNGGIGGGGTGQRCDGNPAITTIASNGLNCYETTQPFGYTDPRDGCPSSGGGGGGGGYNFTTGGYGGSGVIILKYRRPVEATRVIDYLKTGTPAITDYKAGMSGGDYKIQSIQSGITKDRFVVNSSSGSVHIGESAIVIKSNSEVNIPVVLNTKSLLIDGVLNQFSTLSSRPTMYVASQAGNGSGSTNNIDVLTSSTYNRYVEISINNEVISYSIIWKNNIPALTNYYTYSDGYYYSLIQNLAGYGSPNYNRYTFWRRTGTFVWRVIEFL